jgi:NAD(P)-dependent dehydrogenase (short-subunit alcohol dehydrogenase family)
MAVPSCGNGTKGTSLIQDLAPHTAGKTILITGASPDSLGGFFVESMGALKKGPKLLIMAGRSLPKLQQMQIKMEIINSTIETRALVMDLQSFASVRAAAKEVISQDVHIDVLVNNAGIMAPPYSKTIDGFESTFQSNHLSHFLFTNLIMEKLLAAPNPRVVIVSSDGYRLGHVRFNDYNFHVSHTRALVTHT